MVMQIFLKDPSLGSSPRSRVGEQHEKAVDIRTSYSNIIRDGSTTSSL